MQTEVVCLFCRDFRMARYLEHKDSLDREKELSNETVSEAPPQATPTLTPAKDKKNGDKGEGA